MSIILQTTRRAYRTRQPLAQALIPRNRFSTSAAFPETELSVTEGGKQLRAVWSSSDAGQSTYHAVWLRHNCQCPRCVSDYRQLLIQAHELDPLVKISEVKQTGLQCLLQCMYNVWLEHPQSQPTKKTRNHVERNAYKHASCVPLCTVAT